MTFHSMVIMAVFMVYLPVLSVNFAFSQALVKDAYIIIFKQDAGVIDPPNSENANKVSVDEPTSGQNKAELAATLGLYGEIVAVLEVNNGIVVKMNAQEAERWSQDARVLYVEQDREVSAANAHQTDYPVYHNGMLTIPRVDTLQQAGKFQDATFQFDSQTGAWNLLEFQTAPAPQIFLVEGDGVEAIVTDTSPVQVLLKVRGNFSNLCQSLGQTSQRLGENHFDVVISVISTIPTDGSHGCLQALAPFEKIVPLQVYGLPAGIYEYSVNGDHSGAFELTVDNHL